MKINIKLILVICFSFALAVLCGCENGEKNTHENVDSFVAQQDSNTAVIVTRDSMYVFCVPKYLEENGMVHSILLKTPTMDVDTIIMEHNGYVMDILASSNDSVVFVISVGGSASVGFVSKVNLHSQKVEYPDWSAWGLYKIEKKQNGYVFYCSNWPDHSVNIYHRWKDTYDLDMKYISTSDTINW